MNGGLFLPGQSLLRSFVMKRFALLALLAFFSTPVCAQQNMADVIYGQAQPRNAMMSSVRPDQNRSQVSAVQAELRARGYKLKIDGAYGPKTAAALRKFQKKQGLAQSGVMDTPTLSALGVVTY